MPDHRRPVASPSRWIRDAYRRSLGIEAHQCLVAIASSAQRHSLWAHHPTLTERLFEELPMDAYRVVFLPDPGVLSTYGDMAMLMHVPLQNGLLMLRPGEDWPAVARAVAVAADVVIGDGGDTTLHATERGIPTALAAFDPDEAPPGSRQHALGQQARKFHMDGDRYAQVGGLCTVEILTAAAAAADGDTDTALHEMMVKLEPVDRYRPTTAWRCEVDIDADGGATARRFPTTRDTPRRPGHLVADVRCLDVDARDNADIIVRCHEPLPEAEAHAEAWALLTEHPLASVAAVRVDGDELILTTPTSTVRVRCRPEHSAVAVSVWFEADRPDEGQWHLTGPARDGTVQVTAPDPTLNQ